MSEIVKMAAPTMSSREIADLTGKRHDHVLRDVRVLKDQLGEMFGGSPQTWVHPQNGQKYEEFVLDKDTCLTLLLGYDAVARMKVVKRWQELESGAVALPQTLPEALRLAAEAIEERDRLALEGKAKDAALAEAAPKVEVFERIADATGSMTLRETATTLKYPERKLILWMQQNNWLYRRPGRGTLLGYAEKIKAGHLEHKVTVIHNDRTGEDETRESVRVTSLGLTVLARRLASVTEELPALYGAHCGQGASLEARP
jgi:phage antirepressor YoqD-like protein